MIVSYNVITPLTPHASTSNILGINKRIIGKWKCTSAHLMLLIAYCFCIQLFLGK